MKKLFALLLIAILTLSATAFAATYNSDDINFEYSDAVFEVSYEDRTDDESTVILSGKDEAWGTTYIRFYVHDLEDGETFPTMEDFSQMPDTTVTQGGWLRYEDVFMYTLENDDDTTQSFFIAPVRDEDGEIEDLLTVEISVTRIEDDEIAMGRDDMISEVVDTLVVDD